MYFSSPHKQCIGEKNICRKHNDEDFDDDGGGDNENDNNKNCHSNNNNNKISMKCKLFEIPQEPSLIILA